MSDSPPPKKRRFRRAALATLGALAVAAAAIGIHLRIALGPELPTPPLVSATPAPNAMVFHDVSVFTGLETTLQPHRDVVVRDGRIVSVKPTGEAAPEGAQIVDGAGRTLLPGFIDAHTHVVGSGSPPWAMVRTSDAHNLEAYAYAGVTTTYMLGGIAGQMASLEKAMARGEMVGPRLYYTHTPITAPGSHPTVIGKELFPWPLSAVMIQMIPRPRTPAEAEAAVADTVSHDVHFVKAIVDKLPPSAPEMSAEVLKAIVDASHRRKKKVFVHIGTAEDALTAVRAGADVLAHGVYRGALSKEQAEEIARARVPLIFTLAGWVRTDALARGSFKASKMDVATVPASILESLSDDAGRAKVMDGVFGEFGGALMANAQLWRPNVKALYDAGVVLLVGTDSPLPGVFPGSAFHEEMRLLVEYGVPAGVVLLGATARAADVLGLEVGRIEAGRPADLVLVKGDPVARIGDAEQVEMVVLRGRVVKRVR